jgi:hypothetical protein
VAVTIDPTVAGASANSYVTLAEANSYFASRLGSSAWTDAPDDDTRKAALVTAANRIEAELYRGARATDAQRLAWPRSGVWKTGFALPTDSLPEFVKRAQMEEALALLEAAIDAEGNITNPLAASGTEELKSLGVGNVRLDFRDRDPAGDNAAAADDPSRTFASPQAYRELRPYLLTGTINVPSGVRNVRLLRG